MTENAQIAKLALEDGSVFTGRSFGTPGTTEGEVCFNTSMTGYQEILTDPSYHGQIVTMTYPLIGNCGVTAEDVESRAVQVAGFVVREPALRYSNFRADKSLGRYLVDNGIVGISHIDTRALTRRLRIKGAMKGVLSSEILDDARLVEMARQAAGLVGRDLVCQVSGHWNGAWQEGYRSAFAGPITKLVPPPRNVAQTQRPLVVAFDCGMKENICRNLVQTGFDVQVLPAAARLEQIMELSPAGIFVSNGPGDPEPIAYMIETIRQLIRREIPMFGICLGIQLIGQALGGKTYKLKFGHRGGNQPVKNLDTGKVEITSQNHGFAVDIQTLDQSVVRMTHVNLNDQTLEGIAHSRLPLFAVQYHPEASPGPHDSCYLFEAFYRMVQSGRAPEKIC